MAFTTPVLSPNDATGAARKTVGSVTTPVFTSSNAKINNGNGSTTVGANGQLSSNKIVDTKVAQDTLSKNFNQFLSLLTTQMKNQDPLKPMDTAQFTSQLVQYSQVEQQINTNSTLNSILSQLQSNQALQAAGFLGNTAEVGADSFNFTKGAPVTLGYGFPRSASSVTVNIFDTNGALVRSFDAPATPGHGTVEWDGKNNQGLVATNGGYKFSVTGNDTSGAAMNASATSVVGVVSDVQIVSGAAMVKVNGLWHPLSDIVSLKPTAATPVATAAVTPKP
ncbi:MAG: flagellar biosynthesis protein FlgD [Alphaproteobacteria bacterium]|nr:flagellar biosynthesis protein FlgD [Alphaproteobacteria bacterium]